MVNSKSSITNMLITVIHYITTVTFLPPRYIPTYVHLFSVIKGAPERQVACSKEAVLQMLMQEMKNCGFCGGKVRIHHCRNLKAAEALRNELLKINSYCDIEIRPCGGLCSFYAEEGGLLIGYET